MCPTGVCRDSAMTTHAGLQRLLRRTEGVEQVECHLPVVAFVVPLQQHVQRMVTCRASSNVDAGT